MVDYFNSFCHHIGLEISGIIHVGAHECEERDTYIELFRQSDKSILWVEALPDVVDEIKQKYTDINILQACIGATNEEESTFFVSNYSQCAGCLPFSQKHKETFSSILQEECKVKKTTLDTLISKADKPLRNMLVVSVNGAELQVLKGAETLLEFIDFVVVRFETLQFHDGGATIYELRDWMGMNGFKQVESVKVNEHSDAILFISMNADYELKKQEKQMSDQFQLMIEQYNQKNNTNITTQVYNDLEE